MTRAFISCVKEDLNEAEYLREVLGRNGIETWLFSRNLKIGQDWKQEIRNAITEGSFYIPIFSQAWASRAKSYMNEELNIAIEELRLRPSNAGWFLPISLDGTFPPDQSLGGSGRLSDIQVSDVSTGWTRCITEMLETMGVSGGGVNFGDPLAPGLSDRLEIRRGTLTYLENDLGSDDLTNRVNFIDEGFIGRSKDNHIVAAFHVVSPTVELLELGERLGLANIFLVSDAPSISASPDTPTKFLGETLATMRKGEALVLNGHGFELPQDLSVHSLYEVAAWSEQDSIKGAFKITLRADAIGETPVGHVSGEFQLDVVPGA